MRYHTTSRLSDHILETPEGYLLCRDVAIARTGAMEYLPDEVPVDSHGKDVVLVYRLEQDLFAPEAMASYEGKSITLDHPDNEDTEGFVTPDNWRELARGHVQNVRQGAGEARDLLLADLLIMDAEAIAAVRGGLREVSCGYDADYEESGPGVGRQINIRGNHVALVDRGRCGPRCKIQDSKRTMTMKNKRSWLDRLFGNPKVQRALDEAAAELEAKDNAPPARDNGQAPEQASKDQEPSQPATDTDARLDEILLLLRTLVEAQSGRGNQPGGQDSDPEKTGDEDPAAGQAEDSDPETPGRNQDSEPEAAKTGDRKARSSSMRAADAATVRKARIIAPHIAARVGDSHCAVVRASLRSAMRDAALAPSINAALRGATLDGADCLSLDAAFVTAAEVAKVRNNARSADSLGRAQGKDAAANKATTPAELNDQFRKYRDSLNGRTA